jgi:hypothetical protein
MKEATNTRNSSNQPRNHPRSLTPTAIHPFTKKVLAEIGITNPETISTKQASVYLSQLKGVPTASSTLEVYRCQSRGPKYKKIGSRVFYTADWLDEYAQGVEVKIYDPAKN